MPKAKRAKKISLTKTDKKGLLLKQKIVDDVRSCVEEFSSIYVFTYRNMRNEKMKEIRQQMKPSKFFFGKNKVIGIGLGRNKDEEISNDLHKLTDTLKGSCGLLFTNSSKKEVTGWFDGFTYVDFARSGFKAKRTVDLCEGPLPEFSHAIEPYLRQLGLPTKLEKGVVTLIKDYTVCKKGAVLTPEQAKILELIGEKMAEFKLILRACWNKEKGFEQLSTEEEDEAEEDDDDDENDVEMDD
ncbi:PREDICTED: mRNA turnover protein 4 homolog [Nicrophorus vespilloides]|uniref:Ribosome assembly factor mrt4 n=1 Tax=Nicrophorus vespilloides TaxID=110193 RepID=A0ABM1MW11_NICVS|nr:PREDICTED: mRNA turnover protein 4 homolog [Nicrophorus vespilloides]